MIDLDKFMESCKPYQKIIDGVTLDECICVAMGIPIGCNHEEMIVKAIIQRLLKAETVRADAIEKVKKYVNRNIHFCDANEQRRFYEFLEQLKGQNK